MRIVHIGCVAIAVAVAWLASRDARPARSGSSASMRAYVDPETGAFTGAPPGAGGEAAPAEHAGEAVKEQALPGGGVIVHVPTRLKKPLVARIGCDGRPHIAHEAAADQPTARSSRE